MPFLIILLLSLTNGFILEEGISQIIWGIFGVFMLTIFIFMWFFSYMGTDFEVSGEGIIYKKYFVKKTILFSEIKKIERAKAGLKLSLGKGVGYRVTTTSGEEVLPTYLERGNGQRWNKGILLFLENGNTVYYPVCDIGWVMEAVKAHIQDKTSKPNPV